MAMKGAPETASMTTADAINYPTKKGCTRTFTPRNGWRIRSRHTKDIGYRAGQDWVVITATFRGARLRRRSRPCSISMIVGRCRAIRPAVAGVAARSSWPTRRLLSTEGIESVLISDPPGLRVVDLNRPKALNSLNAEMVATLLPLVQDWQTIGGDVKLVAIRGTGDRAFCAGGDIRALHDCAVTGTAAGRQPAYDFFRSEYTLNHAIGTSRVPFVSILEGIVMGGGVGLSVHGAFRVATEQTVFAMPETGIGFFPDVGGSYFLPRLRGELGMYLGLTGARLRGRDVLTAGVATHYVPHHRVEALEAILLQFAASTQSKAGTLESAQGIVDEEALTAAIASLDMLGDAEAGDAAARPLLTPAALSEIDEAFAQPTLDAVVRAVDALAAEATARGGGGGGDAHWAIGAARELGRASPTSLAVTFEALRRGAALPSLGACLNMEYRIAQRFMAHPDFVCGVGAVLSKGTAPPVWAPPPSAAELEEWFVAGEAGELGLAA